MKNLSLRGILLPLLFLSVWPLTGAAEDTQHEARWSRVLEQPLTKKPATTKGYKYLDFVEKQFFYQLERLVTCSNRFQDVRSLLGLGGRQEALNVNAYDEVADSSWFTNRLGQGFKPAKGKGPEIRGPWTILAAKGEGITPGLIIRDPHGDRYLLKFDPPGHHELASGAEMISTKIFHDAGFNVPDNFLVEFKPELLQLDSKAHLTELGKKRPLTSDDLQHLLARVPRQKEGTLRALASKFIEGEMLGPFPFRGRRYGDKNDVIPHEHRRELRGYRVFAAWLNHNDSREANSLDTFIPHPHGGGGLVKHYLLDFGSTLGSAGTGPKQGRLLHDYVFSYQKVFASLFSLGAYAPYTPTPRWEHIPEYPSVSLFEGDSFDPERWRPSYPNPPFQNMTPRDAFWATKIIVRFTDETIAALVKEARYSDPSAAKYVTQTLIKRRDKIGRHWFSKIAPLDDCLLAGNEETPVLKCTDLAVRSGFEKGMTHYRYRWQLARNGTPLSPWHEGQIPSFPLVTAELERIHKNKIYALRVELKREPEKFWGPPLDILIMKEPLRIIGWQRKSR